LFVKWKWKIAIIEIWLSLSPWNSCKSEKVDQQLPNWLDHTWSEGKKIMEHKAARGGTELRTNLEGTNCFLKWERL
jgi:hypothetical protein